LRTITKQRVQLSAGRLSGNSNFMMSVRA